MIRTIASALATTRNVLVPLPTRLATAATMARVGTNRRSAGTSTSAASSAHAAREVMTSHVILDGGGSQVTLTMAATDRPSTSSSTRLAGKDHSLDVGVVAHVLARRRVHPVGAVIVPANRGGVAELHPVGFGGRTGRCRNRCAGESIKVDVVRRGVGVLEHPTVVEPNVRLTVVAEELHFLGGCSNQLHPIAELDRMHFDAGCIAVVTR